MDSDSSRIPGLWSTRSFERVVPPITVLIVDDDGDGAEALAAALAIEGFRTAVADGGFSALATPRARTPHVIVLDIEMPLCDGFAVAEAMRGSTRFSVIPIIAYTSLNEEDVIARGKEVQIDAFCRKGTSLRFLLELIDRLTPAEVPDRRITPD